MSSDTQNYLIKCYDKLDKCLEDIEKLEILAKDSEEKDKISKLKKELMRARDLVGNRKSTPEQRICRIEGFLQAHHNFHIED